MPLIIDVDSSTIEGHAYNYKNEWRLDNLVAFDSLGFCQGMKLCPGNTFSSQGAGECICEIFPVLPVDEVERRKAKKKRFLRSRWLFLKVGGMLPANMWNPQDSAKKKSPDPGILTI